MSKKIISIISFIVVVLLSCKNFESMSQSNTMTYVDDSHNEVSNEEIPEYHRDEWESSVRNTFWDPIREKEVGMRNYQLYLATKVDITDPEVFSYTCYYCGDEFSDYSKFDWDHIVPLKYAHDNGAYAWSNEEKIDFAHDEFVGLLSCATCNRVKGAKGPSEWMPELHQEEYCKMFMEICNKYNLEIAEEDELVIFEYID